LAVMGAAQVNTWTWGPVGEILGLYGQITGSGSGFGFFAPEIGPGMRTEFDIEKKDGTKITTTLQAGLNREGDLRVGNLLNLLSRAMQEDKARRAVAASWAGKMFARYPDATKVGIRMETIDVPTMKEFRDGVRYTTWKPTYSAQFVRKGGKS
jgi:hypothetical protein